MSIIMFEFSFLDYVFIANAYNSFGKCFTSFCSMWNIPVLHFSFEMLHVEHIAYNLFVSRGTFSS